MDIYIDDLIRKLVEIRKDGYHYCSINTITGDDEFCGLLSVLAIDDGGNGEIDYADEIDITEVEADELNNYAFQNKPPAPNRKSITDIKITY